jgi:hypothetical protein
MSNRTSNNNRQHHATIQKSISVSTRTASSSTTMLMLKLAVVFVSLVSVWFNLKMHDHQQHELTTTAEAAVEYYSETPSVRSSSKSLDRIMSLRTTNTNTTATKPNRMQFERTITIRCAIVERLLKVLLEL